MANSCGADTLANSLTISLLNGKSFNIPEPDFTGDEYQIPDFTEITFPALNALTNENLTTRVVGGTGTFDYVMSSINAHLKKEYENQRITGNEYTKAYIELASAALTSSVQFLLGKDTAYWQAVLIQQQAKLAEAEIVKARVELVTAKVTLETARINAFGAEAQYALTKMKISSEDATYCNLLAQKTLILEQVETARAQTLDTRTDGATIVGSVGKQKALYAQQITSYQRDAEVKAAKLFTDAWITQKTLDEGLLPPTNFENASLDEVLTVIKTNNNF